MEIAAEKVPVAGENIRALRTALAPRRSVQTAAHFFAIKFCVRAYYAMPFLKKNSI